MTDYTTLDTAILAAIDECRGVTCAELCANKPLMATAKAMSDQMYAHLRPIDRTPDFRMLDRRLQALRKAGKISLHRNGRRQEWWVCDAT